MRGPYIPESELLHTAAPLTIWEACKRESARAPMKRFKAGAAIFNAATKEVIGTGCAHPSHEHFQTSCTLHAERHALRRSNAKALEGAWICIYTMTDAGGCAWSSRPCYSCALALYNKNIERIIYPERNPDNTWDVVSLHPEELIMHKPISMNIFARQQRTQVLSY
jgi:tRNA(Arg) A34 adenosine deaminase TadA